MSVKEVKIENLSKTWEILPDSPITMGKSPPPPVWRQEVGLSMNSAPPPRFLSAMQVPGTDVCVCVFGGRVPIPGGMK